MKVLMFLVMALMAVGCVKRNLMLGNEYGDINAVRQEILAKGERGFLQEIYVNKSEWDTLLGNISTGTPGWLSIAARLHPFSDAGSSVQLKFAVAEALAHKPEAVLDFIGTNSEFALNDICSGIDIDDPRFNTSPLAAAEIDRRMAAVRGVRDGKYGNIKVTCLSALVGARESLNVFFGEHP